MNKLIALSFLILCSCGSIKESIDKPVNDMPVWVKENPKIEGYYTGVGVADKSTFPQTYVEVAQKNALRKLSEKIELEIERGSIFTQIREENGFDEEYITYVRENAKTYLEAYELNGSFSQKNEYWVYYKLNINKHNEIQKARKEEAIEKAKKHLEKANNTNNSVSNRYSYFIKGIDALKPFLNKRLHTKNYNADILLGSEIIASFRAFVDDFKILFLSKKIKVMLGKEVGNIKIVVEFNKVRQKKISLTTSSKDFEVINFSKMTDEQGMFITSVPKISSTDPKQKIDVKINFDDLINTATTDTFVQKIVKSVATHQITIPIYVYTPLIYVKSKEQHLGQDKTSSTLKYACETALNELGFSATAKKDEAELFMFIESNTTVSKIEKEANSTVLLDVTIKVIDKFENIVFQHQIIKSKVKDINTIQADVKAYKQTQEEIKSSVMSKFVDEFIK